jgi:hypothetical protein
MARLRMAVSTAALTIFFGLSVQATPPSFTTLQPGQFREIEQDLTVNIVFVGYGGALVVDQDVLLQWLPATYRSINQAPSYFGGIEPTGNKFTFNYNIVTAPQPFSDAYFNYLNSIAVPESRTFWQNLYNEQSLRSLDVGQNYKIDSILAERWLAENGQSMLGVNTRQYTIFFVNWHGRSDFKFHVYSKTQERDVDTGVSVDDLRYSPAIAGGGTPADDPETPLGSLRRIWFFDLSAGPEINHWNLTTADLDGDGTMDWRLPPIWEYGNPNAYRPLNTLSSDHGRIARFVAIDSLFTTSAAFPVSLSPPRLPSSIQFDVNMFQGNTTRNGLALFSSAATASKTTALQPYNQFSVEVNEFLFAGGAKAAYDCYFFNTNCRGNLFGIYTYFDNHMPQYLEGDADYEVPIFAYLTTNDYNSYAGGQTFANLDGSQAMILETIPEWWFSDFDGGMTTPLLHEIGHHLGLGHPHDGYDSELNIEFGPSGPTYFTWDGDSSSTVMGYKPVNADFSQFDRDNLSRFMTAAYINNANAIAAQILESPRSGQVTGLLSAADTQAGEALTAYQVMDYVVAATRAKAAYENVVAAADSINVHIEPFARPADTNTLPPFAIFYGSVDDLGTFRGRR